MNHIVAQNVQTKFTSEPHLMILIDGEPLDLLLDAACPDLELIGLVPTWLDWMLDDADQQVAHARMDPPSEGRLRVPLLVCPDDLDFSCTTIIADLVATDNEVEWTRLGRDDTGSGDAEAVGRVVEWFVGVEPMRFERAEYEACIDAFRANRTDAQQAAPSNR